MKAREHPYYRQYVTPRPVANTSARKGSRLNNLFFYFMVTQLVFFVTPYFAAPPLEIDIDISQALAVHCVALAAFVGGYGLNALLYALLHAPARSRAGKAKHSRREARSKRGLHPNWEAKRSDMDEETIERWRFGDQFFKAAYVMMFIGTAIVVLQVGVFQNPLTYLKQLLSGSFDSNIRSAFLASSDQGGLPGIIKMWGASPLSTYLFSMSLPSFLDVSTHERSRFERLNKWALGMTFVKVLFSLDRLTLMAIVIANIYMTVRTRNKILVKTLAVVAFLGLVEFVSQARVQGQGITGFMVLYYNLGLVNLQLLMNTLHGYTVGFNTILAPITFVMEVLHLKDLVPISTSDYRYAGAQYIVGYAYQDFGALFWTFFVVLGYIYKTLDRMALEKLNVFYVSIYLVALATTVTYVAVPSFRSVDFWIGVLVPLGLISCFAKRDSVLVRNNIAAVIPPTRRRRPLRNVRRRPASQGRPEYETPPAEEIVRPPVARRRQRTRRPLAPGPNSMHAWNTRTRP